MAAFEHIVFFGDSLTDERNIHDLTSRTTILTLPLESAGYGSAFTNGAVHAQVLTERLGLDAANYAAGGAQAVGSLTLEDYAEARFGNQIPGLDIYQPGASQEDLDFDLFLAGQVDRYLADAAVTPPEPGTAAGFLIGLNDYAGFRPRFPETAALEAAALVAAVVGNTIEAASAVAASGVETILLYTMPNLRFFPLAAAQGEELLELGDQLITAHNAALLRGGDMLESRRIDVEIVDFNRMAAEIADDPSAFGLHAALFGQPILLGTGGNPTLEELPDGTIQASFPPNPLVAGADPDQLGFIDLVHPTAAVHGVLGVFSATSLTSQDHFLGAESDVLLAGAGRDLVLAGAGGDVVLAGAGADVILAGLGNDRVGANAGDDIVIGGSGRDLLRGGRGDDVIADGAGRDFAFGGRGADLLIDGDGFDLLMGGCGNDAFVLVDASLRGGDPALSGGRMSGGRGEDRLYLLLSDEIRALVEDEVTPGARAQHLDTIGLETHGIESVVFLDAAEDVAEIATAARLGDAMLWNLV